MDAARVILALGVLSVARGQVPTSSPTKPAIEDDEDGGSELSDVEISAIAVGIFLFVLLLIGGLYMLMQNARIPSRMRSPAGDATENPLDTSQKI